MTYQHKFHQYSNTLDFSVLPDENDEDREVDVEYTYTAGQAAVLYGDTPTPADPPEIEIQRLWVDGKEQTLPDDFTPWVDEFLEKYFDELVIAANERDAP